MSKLLIVESPAKTRKLKALLGDDWVVEASRGHVRDLPDDTLGVDIKAGFAPQYRILPDQYGTLKRLKKAASAAAAVYLATDPDREGEAIAWHLLEHLRDTLKGKPVHRVTFTAITTNAVQAAVANPRRLDLALVEAQQTRRILDRLVGYLVSPLACQLLSDRYSAGRVQSVCLRLVVDREQEIERFQPSFYNTYHARFDVNTTEFTADLTRVREQVATTWPPTGVEKLAQTLTGATFRVDTLETSEVARHPWPPFTTSTLQQAASQGLGFSPDRTMALAQRLYEQGWITYMRTDAVTVAPEAQEAAWFYIEGHYGPRYLPLLPQVYTAKSSTAQESHEAIRPTDLTRLASDLSVGEGAALYDLIWKRFIASQMADARYTRTLATLIPEKAPGQPWPVAFTAKGRTLTFEGFLKVYEEEAGEEAGAEPAKVLPPLIQGQRLTALNVFAELHETQPPPRYTEASLIRELEARGIGRPSTYAGMLHLIREKGYVRLEQKRLLPTAPGRKLCAFLVQHFPTVFEVAYTAQLEAQLDQIAAGKSERLMVLQTFWMEHFLPGYQPLAARVNASDPSPKVLKVVGVCPKCGSQLVERKSAHGTFAGCERFPKCTGRADTVRLTALPGAKP